MYSNIITAKLLDSWDSKLISSTSLLHRNSDRKANKKYNNQLELTRNMTWNPIKTLLHAQIFERRCIRMEQRIEEYDVRKAREIGVLRKKTDSSGKWDANFHREAPSNVFTVLEIRLIYF